jgi:hypothetical protein
MEFPKFILQYLYDLGVWNLIRNEKPIILFEKTVMRLRSQKPLHVHGYAGHPGQQGGGQEMNNPEKMIPLRRIPNSGGMDC